MGQMFFRAASFATIYNTLITPYLYPYDTLITPLFTPLLHPYYTIITPYLGIGSPLMGQMFFRAASFA
jgi:hypothetical protein